MADFTPAPGADAARHAVSGQSVGISAACAAVSSSADVSDCARERALELLRVCDPFEKAAGVTALRDAVRDGAAHWHPARQFLCGDGEHEAGIPGRPATPQLVSPRELKQRAVTSVDGRAALLHALAHIEFNAINLALDALWRFDGLPSAYYDDWLQVAAEEAYHFSLLVSHLRTLGDRYDYGCFPAHDGLWDMARRTSGDWLARLALVPRTLEARGLDASPPIKAKLSSAGDKAGAAILDIILRDEIGHVAIGNRWYRWGCERAGCEPVETYARLAAQYGAPRLRGPFNLEARRAAGFDDAELAALQAGE
ncbi:ferritin-like domain-containing protein [Pandoraea oxalativorans]|uniref:ferritin-like domain-containing protein n=1 Tax=Pandoraea oxalativorans TaxID=573737 RepID=UPI000A032063|nr:ferritin-like domain-containing protein [Pandoraea oxalativorans]